MLVILLYLSLLGRIARELYYITVHGECQVKLRQFNLMRVGAKVYLDGVRFTIIEIDGEIITATRYSLSGDWTFVRHYSDWGLI